MSTTIDLPIAPAQFPTTTHRVRWGEHVDLLKQWRRRPPSHPENPRYRACDFRVEGRYSLFERAVNVFRDRGWLDPPPPEFAWAEIVVFYAAEDDPMDGFDACPRTRGRDGLRS